MAKFHHIESKKHRVFVTFEIESTEELNLASLKNDVVILPIDSLEYKLTIGKLGNSNRIMLPSKILFRHRIENLVSKAASKIHETKQGKYLIIELEKTVTEKLKNQIETKKRNMQNILDDGNFRFSTKLSSFAGFWLNEASIETINSAIHNFS